MKAIILSGGMGKRLKPLTDYLPKPLVPICNVPIIEWQIRYFKKFKINEFVICAGYRADQIIKFINSKNFDIIADFSVEKCPLGTGGAIRNAKKFIGDEDFFVINGDVITDLDLKKLEEQINSIAVIPLRTNFGVVNISGNQVKKFEEKPELLGYWMNAGIYYLQNDILRTLPKKGSIEHITFPNMAKSSRLKAVKFKNPFWYSIDSHKDMDECANQMQSIKYDSILSKQ